MTVAIDYINIGLGFLEGFALIISPCILPILPIILAGSLEGSKKRPLGIVLGFILTFSLFTFFSRALVRYSGIDLSIIRYASFILLLLFGLVMLSTYLTELFARLTRRFANVGHSLGGQEGFKSGVIFGGLVALIWTPCAGPILAAVIVQTVIQQTTLSSFLVILAFGLGAAVPMLLIALLGRSVMERLHFFKKKTVLFRKILGVIIILSVGYMVYGEGAASPLVSSSSQTQQAKLIDGLYHSYSAPKIEGIDAWINSSPLTLEQLKGKVVLIDFWTYSCINCVRTFPYLKDWYAKYHKEGLEIIGVHAPEFEFEKNVNNVKNAVEKYEIKYPIALDNHFVTWRNFNNSYWPAHYLIDKNGKVVYQHFGEGEYATTENNIRFLLGLNGVVAEKKETPIFAATPETYLGFARMDNYASPESITHNKMATYTFPESLASNQWALQGTWIVTPQNIISAGENAALKIHFNARKVFVVMGNATGFPIRVKLMLNGETVVNEKGKDVSKSVITVDHHGLFEAIVLPRASNGILQLNPSAPGLEVYTFTFGG